MVWHMAAVTQVTSLQRGTFRVNVPLKREIVEEKLQSLITAQSQENIARANLALYDQGSRDERAVLWAIVQTAIKQRKTTSEEFYEALKWAPEASRNPDMRRTKMSPDKILRIS